MVVYNPQEQTRKAIVEHLVALEEALNRTLQEAKDVGLDAMLIQTQHPVVKAPQLHIHIRPHD